jgi:class 3 adenylate cyclase
MTSRHHHHRRRGRRLLSGDAYRQVRGKTSLAFDDLGERALKNIDQPVRLYTVRSASFSTEPTKLRSKLPQNNKMTLGACGRSQLPKFSNK